MQMQSANFEAIFFRDLKCTAAVYMRAPDHEVHARVKAEMGRIHGIFDDEFLAASIDDPELAISSGAWLRKAGFMQLAMDLGLQSSGGAWAVE
eukprot:6844021-Lingulodinium_polyedra.AAC.1